MGIAAGALLGCANISFLPLVGVGKYSNLGEGFCYIDWHDVVSTTLMLIILLPSFVAVLGLNAALLKYGGWPRQLTLLMSIGFISAWSLWVPAIFIGYTGASFPQHYMISGALLGH